MDWVVLVATKAKWVGERTRQLQILGGVGGGPTTTADISRSTTPAQSPVQKPGHFLELNHFSSHKTVSNRRATAIR